jgi:hypothetical protein
MFIPRSLARIRAARTAFLLLAAVPTAAVIGWAAYLHSASHRTAIERQWQDATGLPLTIGRIEHPRPGVIRAHDCILPATADRPAFVIPLVELESSADEDRLRLGCLSCDPAAASTLASLARAWIMDDVRFRRTCIVDVVDFHWADEPIVRPRDQPPTDVPLRVECVVKDHSRAVRVVWRGDSNDEVRVVRQTAAEADAKEDRLEIDARCSTPIPLAVLVAASGVEPSVATARAVTAHAAGEIHAVWQAGNWRGTAQGRITGIDLAAMAAAVGSRGGGEATIDVARLVWEEGRLTDGLVECGAGSGWIDGQLFDRIVLATGARPAPAAGSFEPQATCSFDAVACIATASGQGIQFLPAPRLPAALAIREGAVLLAPPPAPVPNDRLAWMLSSPGTAFGPAAGPGAWLMSVLPSPAPPTTGSGRQF